MNLIYSLITIFIFIFFSLYSLHSESTLDATQKIDIIDVPA